ncbi:carbohydrate kinase family protein [uncultured Thermanaerothrix sp.]|uniref:carbohydrate kinase family protein n=1 Tax=uncultured Thermanaerothrix sp. TaxID=1195149 RepID=UPI002628886D|nr:carbohydrate kinase family protein [uncultured Thermanaerothrix sp.]
MTQTFDYDVFCLGGAAVDWILRVPRLPQPDEKLVATFAGRVAGGLVANTACAAARLGLRVAWSGYVGDDEGGEILRRGFEDFGVELVGLEPSSMTLSDFTVILLEPSGRRTILVVSPERRLPPLTDAVINTMAKARLVYTVPWTADWIREVARICKRIGVPLVLDMEASNFGSPLEDENDLLSAVCLLFCPQESMENLSIGEETAWNFIRAGVEQVVITQGAEGATVLTRDGKFSSPAFKVPVVDTTGAGDCFHAAYIAAWLWGWSPFQAVRFASAAAALSVQHLGARGGFPTRERVLEFLSEQGAALW